MMFKLGMKTGKILGRLSEKFGRFGKQKPLKAKLARFKNQSKRKLSDLASKPKSIRAKNFIKKNKLPLAVGGAFLTGGTYGVLSQDPKNYGYQNKRLNKQILKAADLIRKNEKK